MKTIFISDLHLDHKRPKVINSFIEFITNSKQSMERLYILGDFVESWVGDDDPAIGTRSAFEAIRTISDRVDVFFMHGNRDFMISKKVCERYGMTLINEPTQLDLYQRNILLMHGDTLCTDDVNYQKFRSMVRNKEWQNQMRMKPLEERLKIADQLRIQSKNATDTKKEIIMDVNKEEVVNCLSKSKADILIHGHTHRPKIHDLTIDRRKCKRIVLGDWEQKSYILELDKDQISLAELNLS